MPDIRSRPVQIVLVLVLLAAAGLFAMGARDRAANQARLDERAELATALRAVPLMAPAPDITMFDRSETPTKLSSYRGRVVLVNFWATWCGPCIAEMPSLIALQGQLDPADIAFVSIAEDDFWPPVDQFLAKNPLPFDIYRDRPPRVEKQFQVGSYPVSFLIDRDGTALYRFNGAMDWNTPQVKALIATLDVGNR